MSVILSRHSSRHRGIARGFAYPLRQADLIARRDVTTMPITMEYVIVTWFVFPISFVSLQCAVVSYSLPWGVGAIVRSKRSLCNIEKLKCVLHNICSDLSRGCRHCRPSIRACKYAPRHLTYTLKSAADLEPNRKVIASCRRTKLLRRCLLTLHLNENHSMGCCSFPPSPSPPPLQPQLVVFPTLSVPV